MTTLAELRAWALQAPPGTIVPVSSLVELLDGLEDPQPIQVTEAAPETWREKLWSVPAEVRLGVSELAEAFGKPRSFIYARTGPRAANPIPCRKLDGALSFTAGEARAWLRATEAVVHAGPMESPSSARRLVIS